MRWLIDYIRSCFCKHEFKHVNMSSFKVDKFFHTDTHYTDTYICEKCGRVIKVTT